MALYVNPRTGSLRDVIIWIVEELKKLKARVYKLEQGGSSGGSQNLQQTLDNGSIAFLNLEENSSLLQFDAQYLTLENINTEGIKSNLSIGGGDLALGISNASNSTTVSFNMPLAYTVLKFPSKSEEGEYTLATIEDIPVRTQGVQNITLDGMSSVYNIPHGLGSIPVFAYAGRGNSTNFDVFNTTWDLTNITITYENPPIAGSLDVNWIALK